TSDQDHTALPLRPPRGKAPFQRKASSPRGRLPDRKGCGGRASTVSGVTYAVSMTCEFCGHELPEGARFCPNCGSPVASTVGTEERKVVTVLFADLVDSTGLAQRVDSERAREVLGLFYDAATEELLALRGQPEKFIGDAVMAVFGLPQVHEDDAVRAVRAGLAIRDRTHRLGREMRLPETLE